MLSDEEIADLIYNFQFINNEYKNWKTMSREKILAWVTGKGHAYEYEDRCHYTHVMAIAKIFQSKRERPFGIEPSLGVDITSVLEREHSSGDNSPDDQNGQQ